MDISRTKSLNYAVLDMPDADHEYLEYERLVCPLSTDGQTVEMLINVIVPSDRPDTLRLKEA